MHAGLAGGDAWPRRNNSMYKALGLLQPRVDCWDSPLLQRRSESNGSPQQLSVIVIHWVLPCRLATLPVVIVGYALALGHVWILEISINWSRRIDVTAVFRPACGKRGNPRLLHEPEELSIGSVWVNAQVHCVHNNAETIKLCHMSMLTAW